jgi:Putative enzyme of poly-gamma-glutamate biosynthesis (capsule formation)
MSRKLFLISILYFFSFGHCAAQWAQDLVRKLTVSPADTVSLVFLGDIMQHGMQLIDAKARNYDYMPCFAGIAPLMQAADLAVVNLETAFAGQPYTGYPVFSSPDTLVPQLKASGADLLLTANNHIGDKGGPGLKRSLQVFDSTGVLHTGTFRSAEERQQRYPLMVERKGIRLAFLNYTYSTNGFTIPLPYIVNRIDTVQIAEDIQKAKRQGADFIIAGMHWGEEYQLKQSAGQQALAAFLVRHGVDLIIGSHPHVPQGMELLYYPNGEIKHVIAYSLGNVISNQPFPHTQIGLCLKIGLIKSGLSKRIYTFTHEWIASEHRQEGGIRTFYAIPLAQSSVKSESIHILPDGSPRGTVDFVTDSIPGKKSYTLKIQK